MAERRALLLASVDALLHGVDVNECHGVLAGQRSTAGQICQQHAAHILQLRHIPPGEGPQERAQRGRGPDPAEQRQHRAVPQQVHVIDAARTRDHPSSQAGAFTLAFTPHRWPVRTCSFARGRPGRYARAITGTRHLRHEIRGIKRRMNLRQLV
jgi:hypothetical protein